MPLRNLRRNLLRKLSENTTCPESHPKSPSKPPFGALRSMPGVPKASPEATLSKPPFEPPLFGLSFGKRHVSRYLIQENPECTRMRHVRRAGKPPGWRAEPQ